MLPAITPRAAGAAACVFVASSAALAFLGSRLDAAAAGRGFPQPGAVLDMRFGYSPAQAASLLHAWGTVGRRTYIACQVLDVLVHCQAYGVLLVWAMQRLASLLRRRSRGCATPAAACAWLPAWPVAMVLIDWAEDAGQLGLVAGFDDALGTQQPPSWATLARAASAANQTKWAVGGAGLLASLLVLACAAMAAGRSSGARQERRRAE